MHTQAVEHARLTDGEVADIDHLLYLAEPFLQRLTHLIGNQGAKILLTLPQPVTDLTYDLAPLRCRTLSPDTKSLLCGSDHTLAGCRRGRSHRGDSPPIRRGNTAKGRPAAVLVPVPARRSAVVKCLDAQPPEKFHPHLPAAKCCCPSLLQV